MNPDKQIKALAELDGWTFFKSKHGHWHIDHPTLGHHEPMFGTPLYDSSTGKKIEINPVDGCSTILPDYLTSYDAIIPLIQKQDEIVKGKLWFWLSENHPGVYEEKPDQLCEALLRAHNLWEE